MKKHVSVRLDEAMQQGIDKYAKEKRKTFSSATRDLIEDSLDKKKNDDIDLTIAKRILEKLDKQI